MAVSQLGTYVVPVAMFDDTGLTGNLSATTVYPIPAGKGGMYRVHLWMRVTTAAATSSTLPNANLLFTSGGVAITTGTSTGALAGINNVSTSTAVSIIGTDQGNTTTTCASSCIGIFCDASTNIQVQTTNFAANASMTYELRVRVEYLG